MPNNITLSLKSLFGITCPPYCILWLDYCRCCSVMHDVICSIC